LARFALLPDAFEAAEDARCVVSDTLGGPNNSGDYVDLRNLHWALGDVASRKQQNQDPTRKDRKTSPLRFRITQLGGAFHIAAVWDKRSAVTGNQPDDFKAVVDLLASRGKEIGRLLQAAL